MAAVQCHQPRRQVQRHYRPAADAAQAKLTDLQVELRQAQERIRELEQLLVRAEDGVVGRLRAGQVPEAVIQLQEQVATLEAQCRRLRGTRSALHTDLETLGEQNHALRQQNADLLARVAELESALGSGTERTQSAEGHLLGLAQDNAALRADLDRMEHAQRHLGSIAFLGLANAQDDLDAASNLVIEVLDSAQRSILLLVSTPLNDELAVVLSEVAVRGVRVHLLYDLGRHRRWMDEQKTVLATVDPHSAAADEAVAQLKRWRAIKGMFRTARVQFAGSKAAVRHSRLLVADGNTLLIGGFDCARPSALEAFACFRAHLSESQPVLDAAEYFSMLWQQREDCVE